jgi:three-Cys-motif partner protein
MSVSPFFDEPKEWSQRKLNLISKYTDAMSRILNEVYYVDGFAGRGWYGKDGEQRVAGSPLRAAEYARSLRTKNRNHSLYCLNVESDRETFDQLCTATLPYSDVTTNLFGPFADNIGHILKLVRDKPVMCFLDPFGIDGMDMSAIEQLVARRGAKTDLWIRFDPGEARRRDGYYISDEPSATKQFDILCRVYGIENPDTLHSELDASTPDQRIVQARRVYMKQLLAMYRKHNSQVGYVGAYHIRTIEGESKYWLIAATAHPKGYVLTSDLLHDEEVTYNAEVDWYRQRQTSQLSIFAYLEPSPETIFATKVEVLAKQIRSECSGRTLTRLQVHTQLLQNGWFGRIKSSHVNKALRQICESGEAKSSGKVHSDNKTSYTFN